MKKEDVFFVWIMEKEWPQMVCFTRFIESDEGI